MIRKIWRTEHPEYDPDFYKMTVVSWLAWKDQDTGKWNDTIGWLKSIHAEALWENSIWIGVNFENKAAKLLMPM